MQNIQENYNKKIIKEMSKEFDIKNTYAVPKIQKVVVNAGIGEAIKNKDLVKTASEALSLITGQKPSVREARVSVATFGLRRGMPVGVKVTLRGKKMYAFLERLFAIVLPRLRDFRGVSRRAFDGHGNYTLGLSDVSVFPEIDPTKFPASLGLEITIVTDKKDKVQSEKLLEMLGMPFEDKEENNKA